MARLRFPARQLAIASNRIVDIDKLMAQTEMLRQMFSQCLDTEALSGVMPGGVEV